MLATIGVVSVIVGIALRLIEPGPMWLDEAQTVATARDGFGALVDGLRTDGHPPLYYAALIVWTTIFGDGNTAIRSLSIVISLLTIVLVWHVAERSHGRTVAWFAVIVLATNPFAVRYATEARMYALFTLGGLVLYLTVDRLAERAGWGRSVAVAVATALVVLTHYWALFLVAAVGLWALLRWRDDRPVQQRIVVAIAVGGLAFVPWLGVFLHQLQNTGTPWATTPGPPSIALSIVADLAGGRQQNLAVLFALVLWGAVLIGAVAAPSMARWQLALDLRGQAPSRVWIWLAIVPMAIGSAAVLVTQGAFASRYAAGIVGFVAILAALGLAALCPRELGVVVAVAIALLGTVVSLSELDHHRTQAGQLAEALHDIGPDDLVVVCPDQLGPALARALGDSTTVLAYPTLDDASQVDWTDYEARNEAAQPSAIADVLAQRVGSTGRVWLVTRGGYRTFGTQCEQLEGELAVRLGAGTTIVDADADVFEPARLAVLPSL